jgi:inner membrane protein
LLANTEESAAMGEILARLRASVTIKLLYVGFLVLLLLIPMGMIQGVVQERQHLHASAKKDIMEAWGRQQCLGGPILTLPYRSTTVDAKGNKRVHTTQAHFLPQRLSIRGRLDTQMRHRGIYEVPVYTASLQVAGRFDVPDIAALGIDARDVDWDHAYLSVALADARGIKEPIELRSDMGEGTFEPGGVKVKGFHPQVVVPIPALVADGEPVAFDFAFELKLNGTETLDFLPLGDRTEVQLSSAWPSPSFFGAYLPDQHDIDASGFTAQWKVLHLGRNYPTQWRAGEVLENQISGSAFGVNLLVPVGTYQKSTRAAKYAVLFIGLTFLGYLMFEVFASLRLHPFQYLLVGFANCLFYLLLLSLSEHTSFGLAYTVSAAASTALVVGYSMSILEARHRALTMLGVLTGLYTFLYVTLRAEDYAMLIGALALFVILAVIMYLTRRIDWYRVSLDLKPEWPSSPSGRAQATPSG